MSLDTVITGDGGNIKFQPNSAIAIIGSTGSGKTWFVYKFLRHLNELIEGTEVDRIMYRYGVYQSLFDEMKQTIPQISFHQGLPDRDEIEQLAGGLLILDDLMAEVAESRLMQELTVLYLSQNLFQSGKCSRSIALNTQVIVLMRNMRNASQIREFARQIYPGRSLMLQEIYEDAVRHPYEYLIIDMSLGANDNLRLRTRIFPGERGVVYIPKEQ